MSDFFGLELSEPNQHMLTRMMDLFNSKLIKNNGIKITQGIIEKIKTDKILEGKWTKFIINQEYGKLSELHICFRNSNNKMLAEISLDFQLMSSINDVLNISNDAFIQTIKTDTGVKQEFEVREKIRICTEEMIFTVNSNKRRPMMSDQGHISFSDIAQQHDWNFEEIGATGFQSGFASPANIGRLADQLHQTMLGSTRKSLFRNPTTSTPGRGQPISPVPRFNPNQPPPNFSGPTFSPRRGAHLYDTIDTTSEGSEEVDRQRRRPKKQKGEKTKEDTQDCEYSFVFKKNTVSKQEKCIKAIIENLNEIRKKKPETANETLTKSGFEALAQSIFQPLEDLNAEINNDAETSDTQILDSTVVEEEIRLDPIPSIVTRSKSKDQSKDPKDKEDEEWH